MGQAIQPTKSACDARSERMRTARPRGRGPSRATPSGRGPWKDHPDRGSLEGSLAMLGSTRRRSDRPNPARSQWGSGLEVLEGRQLLSGASPARNFYSLTPFLQPTLVTPQDLAVRATA